MTYATYTTLPYFEDQERPRHEGVVAKMKEKDDGVVVFVVAKENASLRPAAIFSTYVLADSLLGLSEHIISHSFVQEGARKGRIHGAFTKDGGRYYVRRFHDTL